MNRLQRGIAALALALTCAAASAAGKLRVEDAWIREAPPGATAMAGYATLRNTGDEPLRLLAVQSAAFRNASVHETVIAGGMSRMRELHDLDIAPGETIALQPGGRHLMLMDPRKPVALGDTIEIVFLLADGTRVETEFEVVADAGG